MTVINFKPTGAAAAAVVAVVEQQRSAQTNLLLGRVLAGKSNIYDSIIALIYYY